MKFPEHSHTPSILSLKSSNIRQTRTPSELTHSKWALRLPLWVFRIFWGLQINMLFRKMCCLRRATEFVSNVHVIICVHESLLQPKTVTISVWNRNDTPLKTAIFRCLKLVTLTPRSNFKCSYSQFPSWLFWWAVLSQFVHLAII